MSVQASRRLRAGSMGTGLAPVLPPSPSTPPSPPPSLVIQNEVSQAQNSGTRSLQPLTPPEHTPKPTSGSSHLAPLSIAVGDLNLSAGNGSDDDDGEPPMSPGSPLSPTSPLEPEKPHALSVADLAAVDELDARPREPENARPRAHELTSTLRVVPHIDWQFSDRHEPHAELSSFFSLVDLPKLFPKETVLNEPCIDDPLQVLDYILLGGAGRSQRQAVYQLQRRTQKVLTLGFFDSLVMSREIHVLALWALAAILGGPSGASVIQKSELCAWLIADIAKNRWDELDEAENLGARFALLRLALVAGLGDESERERADKWNREVALAAAGVSNQDTSHSTPSAPSLVSSAGGPSYTDYEAFRQSVQMRYPAFVPPPSPLPPPVAAFASALSTPLMDPLARGPSVAAAIAAAPAPIPASTPTSAPAPSAVVEACDLFLSQARSSPAAWQLWALQHPRDAAKPWSAALAQYLECRPPSLDFTDKLYHQSIRHLKSLVVVASSLLLDEQAPRNSPAAVHGAACSLLLLLRWFRSAHVLQHEYLAAVLYDAHFYLVLYRFCTQHAILETVNQIPKETLFTTLQKLGPLQPGTESDLNIPCNTSSYKKSHERTHSNSHTDGVLLDKVHIPHLETFVAMAAITRDILSGKMQRVVAVAELPPEPLKKLLMVYNRDLYQAVLGILKMQAPLNGKKWRCINMDIVSAIYLHCDAALNDDWLAGIDVVAAIQHGAIVETGLRDAVAAYNADAFWDKCIN